MTTPDDWILSNRFRTLVARLDEGVDDAEAERLWGSLEADLTAAGADEDADVALPVLERSLEEVRRLIAAWDSGQRALPKHDRELLKRALKAFRKRLKLARRDDESTHGRNPLSKGESSGIVGVKAPEQFSREVWDTLIARGTLRDAGYGLLELVD
jgi:hypothetical protein